LAERLTLSIESREDATVADAIPGVFVSCVSSEFKQTRRMLRDGLDQFHWKVFVQENLSERGKPTLQKVDEKIRRSRCVVHLLGQHPGTPVNDVSLHWLRNNFDQLATAFGGVLSPFLDDPAHTLTYTQWEFWLARLRGKEMFVFEPAPGLALPPVSPPDRGRIPAVSQAAHKKMVRAAMHPQHFDSDNGLLHSVKNSLFASHDERYTPPRPIDFSGYVKRKLHDFSGRDWLMQRLDDWSIQARPKPFLLVAGFGFGKTAIVARLLQRWSSAAERDVVAHFCRYDDDRTLRPDTIVQAVAAQFAAFVPEYRKNLQSGPEIQEALANAANNPLTALKYGLLQPLREIQRTRPCFLLIDALDESMEISSVRGGNTLLQLIGSVAGENELPEWLRVFVTSRKLDTVMSMGGANFEIFDLEKDAGPDGRRDLSEYVAHRVQRSPAIGSFLQHSGMASEVLHAKLSAPRGAFFLLARSVLDDIEHGYYEPSKTFVVPGGMDSFYAQSFDVRVERAKLDAALLNCLLGLVAVARLPLPAPVLAAAAGVDQSVVHAVIQAFSGLLVYDTERGITFAHLSLEQWLSGRESQMASAGRFHIERVASERRLRRHCMAAVADSPSRAGELQRYLVAHGVELFIGSHEGDAESADAFASAVRLLLALRDGELGPVSAHALSSQVDAVMAGCKAQWQRIDDARLRAASAARRAALAAIDAEHLLALLSHKVYETGLYVPAIRVLIECHAERGREILDDLLTRSDENDIVFRHDIGVAYSQAWHAASRTEREGLLCNIERMGGPASSDHGREIAGYAMKNICQRHEPNGWGGPYKLRIQNFALRYAHASAATDRMVAGEMLLALALHGERVDAWFNDPPETDTPFWDPYWLNQRSDIDAIHTALGLRSPNTTADLDAQRSFADAKAQHDLAEALRARLRETAFMRDNRTGRRLGLLIDSFASQQEDALLFESVSLNDLVEALAGRTAGGEYAGPDAEAVLDLLQLLMLHPLWNMTERATELVGTLIKRERRLRGLPLRLAGVEPSYWRIRYGAVDAAYNCGAVDDYAGFFQTLQVCGRDTNCRVRGICADDVDGWVRHADRESVVAMLHDESFAGLLRHWVEHANDVWLLEYLHEIFHDLHEVHRLPYSTIHRLIGKRSRYLKSDDFYKGPVDAFLQEIEQIRQAEWKALRGKSRP
jgi:hypothetical protein